MVRQFLSPRVFALWFLATAVMTVAGPFGTYQSLDLSRRLLAWAGITGLAFVIGIATVAAVERSRFARTPMVRLGLTTVIFTTIFLPLLRGAMPFFGGPPMPLWHMAVVVAMAPISVCLARLLWIGDLPPRAPVTPQPPAAEPEPPRPRLLDRLDPDVQGAIWHLSVRDHYVDVLTERGSASILMRFSDAMSEVTEVEGLQTHRSHWVAKEAVQGSLKRNGKHFVVLPGGQEIPVSRGFLQTASERGYLG